MGQGLRGYAEWLFGLRVQQPREYRRLVRIRRRVYDRVAPLRAEIVRSAEPIPFDELDRSAFTELRPGTAWGRKYDCAWLRVTGEVPAGLTDPVVLLGLRGEGLVVAPDGEVLDAVTTVWQQGDLPHSGGVDRPVRHVDTSSGRVEFYVDAAYNGILLYEYGRAVYHGAHLAVRDDDVFALYYDYLTLVVLAGATEDAALAAELRGALAAAYSRFRAGDAAGARAELAGPLAARSEHDFVYAGIGHGHLDMAWLWPIRETRRKAARTYIRALNTIDERPGYLYGTSQPQQMAWMKQHHPAIFERMKRAVAAGRMELQGAFWVEPDTNLPSGESLVRQAIVGRRFLQAEFGLGDDDLRLCWLPDTFGYSGNLPQILVKSGMDWFQTIKLSWNRVNIFPHRTFRWSGIDGSTVLVHMPPEGDYNSRGAADGLLAGLRNYPERELGTALLVYGSGDGGGGPGEPHLELLEREHDLRGLPRVEFSTATEFFRRLERLDIRHTHRGELYLETHQGTYTTQGAIKRCNRLLERKLHEVEALAAFTGADVRAELEPHWRDVLLNQFHDIIPGSSIARVHREAIETSQRIEAALEVRTRDLLDTTADGPPTAVNLTSFPRDEYVRTGDGWAHAVVDPYAAAPLHPVGDLPPLTAAGDTMSNGVLTLRFGPSGEITSCVDADGIEQARDGLNRLTLHRDRYQFPYDAWDIDVGYLRRTPRVLRPSEVDTRVDGPAVIRTSRYRFGRSSLEQRVVLEAGSAVVRVETTVDWHERHRMLRADFRPTRYGDTARCEIQFGHIERTTTENDPVETAQFEVCAHKWIATEDATGGFALLNDSKYGHRAKRGLLSLNLLRAPTFPDPTADRGRHEFAYAFLPFATGDLARVIREGYRLNHPLRVASTAPFESFARTDGDAVVIETIKPAESGSGVVVRMYESLGTATTTALRTTLPAATATETDLLERPIGPADLDRLEFGPFEIKTIHLQG